MESLAISQSQTWKNLKTCQNLSKPEIPSLDLIPSSKMYNQLVFRNPFFVFVLPDDRLRGINSHCN
jgi:hypothetical protein